MKRIITFVLALSLLISGLVQAEKFIAVDQQANVFDGSSFVGYVENRVIVVLSEGTLVNHAKDNSSSVALNSLDGFSALAQKFQVHELRPMFKGTDVQSMSSATSSKELAVLSRYYVVEFNNGVLDEVVTAYEALPQVDHVEKDAIHKLYAAANDTYYDGLANPDFQFNQWHYWDTYGINAETAWNSTAGDATVVVGVLDSGVRHYHRDLGGSDVPGPADNVTNGNIWTNPGETPGDGIDNDGNGYIDDVIGYDFFESGYSGVSCTDTDCGGKDNDPADHNGHGTHVAGTIGAITNNGTQVAGVAGGFSDGTAGGIANGVKIVPCRIGYTGRYRGQESGFVMMSAAAEAMNYLGNLKASGINVASINCSWGSSNTGGLGAAVDFLLSQDVVIVVAAGNSNSSSADYLGSRGDCVDVGATDKFGDPASFSNYGSWVDIAAPGVEILSTYHVNTDPANDYISVLDGTSMAAPHVAGVIGLLESFDQSLTAQDKIDLIMQNAKAYNMSKNVGVGIVDVRAAMDAAGPNTNPPTAGFVGSPTSGDINLAVNFTDQSTNGPTSWSWTFGDGGTSSAQNPSHTYTVAGTYTVSLTATNANGNDTNTKVGYINATQPSANPPVADFSGTPTSGDAPLVVNFTDLSTNTPSSWSWTFGDGGTSSAQNPSYTYTTAGTYTVSLTATNAFGNDTKTATNYITVNTPPVGGTMHVESIAVTRASKGPNRNGVGTIIINDSNEQPLANASVTVLATGPTGGTATAATDANGVVSFNTAKIKNPSGEWCFEVTNITHASNSYSSGDNHVTKACESGVVFANGDAIVLGIPGTFGLNQNYPNPFNPSTEISFSLPQASEVTLEVFNIKGQKVDILAAGSFSAGSHIVTWDASTKPSGIYFYRLIAGENVDTKKMILMK